ncbi:MAG: hypothetical protein ABI624_15210 [Casimicrobiaceae bacterium]
MLCTSKRVVIAGSFAALALSGCYVVPVNPDGTPVRAAAPAFPVQIVQAAPSYAAPGAPLPNVLQARLYPSNDIATRTGMLSGTVTNMMTGKGRFQLDVAGELLVGEATRVPGDDRAGLASAYGQRGTYMNCEYRMTTPYQGTGTCNLSTGAHYQVHIGV